MVNLPHMLKYVGPQGPIFEYKGAVFFFFFSIQDNHLALVWLVICIHHPQHQRYMGGLVQA